MSALLTVQSEELKTRLLDVLKSTLLTHLYSGGGATAKKVSDMDYMLRTGINNTFVCAELDGVAKPAVGPVITEDFCEGVVTEAAYQRIRWGTDHDAGKEPSDWFWLVGYLAGKALAAAIKGDRDKALHHCISTAAVLANWHAAIKGEDNRMRPGVEPPAGEAP